MRSRTAYAFLAIPLAVLGAFTLAPTLLGLGLAFFDWDGGGQPRFVGLDNFRALARDQRFLPGLMNTIVFAALSTPASVLLGLGLAVAIHARWFAGKAAVRTMLFIPTMASMVAVGFVWRWALDDRGGLIPSLLRSASIDPPDFLNDAPVTLASVPVIGWPIASIALVQVWRMAGFCAVIYLAALARIDPRLYEAAHLDGASRLDCLRRITWPCLASTTSFLLVTGLISALQVFDVVWTLTAGAERVDTTVLNLQLYREYQNGRLGYASAIGAVIFALCLAIVGLRAVRPERAA